MINQLKDILFPKTCLNCYTSLNSVEEFICKPCKLNLPFTSDITNPTNNNLAKKFAFEPKIKSAVAFLYFRKFGVTQKLLYELKYNGKKELGNLLGKWFGEYLESSFSDSDYIFPVPVHRSKLKSRGYNQSEHLAQGLADVLDCDLRTDFSERIIATTSQTKKSKTERWQNMENVYSEVSEDLLGKKIIVVDDVVTTGATVGMLCDRLVKANVAEIHILTLARRD